jgi:acetylornithine/N-succinyldiaminopimelate aminotransferase
MTSSILPVYKTINLEFTSGSGCFLETSNGKKYLDLGSGIAVNSLGYNHSKLQKALSIALTKPWHVSNLYNISGQQDLAKKLCDNSSCDQVFFCNSGAEAIEAALKFTRKYFSVKNQTHKKNILTFENAFHGRTIGALSASGNAEYQKGYEPLLPNFIKVPLAKANTCNIDGFIDNNLAAILIEPIQGEGGIYNFSKDFLQKLALICKEKNILLIADEIQCGIGRTGKLFYHQWHDIAPDIITTAKGIGGGFPLGACLVQKHVGKVMTYGSHGGTYGGNPLAMSAGNAVLDQILQSSFLANIIENGTYFILALQKLQKKFSHIISEIRGTGLMIGIQAPNYHLKIIELLRDHNILATPLLTIPARGEVIRIIPPLIISKEEINLALNSITQILEILNEQK